MYLIDPNQDNSITHSIYKGKIYDRKKIERIYSPDTDIEIRFNSTPLLLELNGSDPYDTPEYDDRILNSIQVYNTLLSENVKQIKLNYITTLSRIFLEEVIVNNEDDINSTNKCAVYRMEYESPEDLPKRFSKAQDLLGYYNGANTNTTFLPQTTDLEFEGVFSSLANRSVHFNAAIKGSLKSINYPSGGYTSFDYEAPQVTADVTKNVHLEAYRNQTNLIPQTKPQDTGYLGDPLPEPGFEAIHLPFGQDITVQLSVVANSPTVDNGDKVIIELTDVMTGEITTQLRALSSGVTSYSWSFDFHIDGGTSYIIKLKIDPFNPAPNEAPFVATAIVNYQKTEFFDAYGIRVKRIIEHPEDLSNPITKRYYYKRAEKAFLNEEDSESAIVTYDPQAGSGSFPTQRKDCCPNIYGLTVYSYVGLISNPFAYFFASADNQVSYKFVTVSYGGDLFEEGGVEKEFQIETLNDPTVVHFPNFWFEPNADYLDYYTGLLFYGNSSDNNTIFNGAPLKQTIIKNDSGELFKVKETIFNYNRDILDQTEGILLISNSNSCITPTSELYNYSVANYNNFSYVFNRTSVQSKDYIGDILPPVLPFESQNGPGGPTQEPEYTFIQSEQFINYHDVFLGRPKTITTTNSDGSINIVKNYYLTPDDLNSLSGVTNLEIDAYNDLISQHRISSPVQVESYYRKNNDVTSIEELKSRQRVTYNTFNGLTLVEKTSSSKLNYPLEVQATFLNYDAQGYVLESSAEDDIISSIIYGYNDKKVIAELVNLSYSLIPQTTIDNIHNLSNTIVDSSSQSDLEAALDQLRLDFPEARINTYVYNTLGQLSSMKDNRGYKVSYIYDACYRLLQVRDQDGNIVEEHNYNVLTNNE